MTLAFAARGEAAVCVGGIGDTEVFVYSKPVLLSEPSQEAKDLIRLEVTLAATGQLRPGRTSRIGVRTRKRRGDRRKILH